MHTISFKDMHISDPALELDPIGLISYRAYKRKRGVLGEDTSTASVDFFPSNTSFVSSVYHPQTKSLEIIRRNYKKFPINIPMDADQYAKYSTSANKKHWLNQQIKEGTLVIPDPLAEEAELTEVLNQMQRMKRRQIMRRLAPRLARARKIAMKRRAGGDILKRRAKALARKTLAKKLLGGRNKADVSTSERARVEKILATRKNAIERLSVKLLPIVRQKQAKRFATNNPVVKQHVASNKPSTTNSHPPATPSSSTTK